MNEIVLAFEPSNKKTDWQCRADGDHNWFYEQRVRFYDVGCQELKAYCPDHIRNVGREPYYDLTNKKITKPPRIYITHHPKSGEWEHLKTTEELLSSPPYRPNPNKDEEYFTV